jgi:hypothetical protein
MGLALTADELRLPLEHTHPYGGTERFPLAQCADASLGSGRWPPR